MVKAIFLLSIFVSCTFISPVHSEPTDIANYDLSLAGYRLGMSYDDASLVRPFHLVQEDNRSDKPAVINAYVNQVYIDDVEMSLWVCFKDKQVNKVVARFSPDLIEEMADSLQKILGKGEIDNRLFISNKGTETRQTIYEWIYPDAKMHLIGISTNSDFASISLVSRQNKIGK